MTHGTLLTESNPKTLLGESLGYRTAVMMLAPADVAIPGKSVCPWSTPACRYACLNTAGRGPMSTVQQARIRRTRLYFEDRGLFMETLRSELGKFEESCKRSGHRPAVRLNCLSDLPVESWGIMEQFPRIQFYDYTKSTRRLYIELPENYHLTFSRSEKTENVDVRLMLGLGINVAIVADSPGTIAETFPGHPIVNGLEHDLTFLRPPGSILYLAPKGRAKKDYSGFVLRRTVTA